MPNLPFDMEARSTLTIGMGTARGWGHAAIEPGHILVGLLRCCPELLPEVDPRHAEETLRAALKPNRSTSGIPAPVPPTIPYDPAARGVLVSAVRAARAAGQRAVRAIDLLEALRTAGDAATASVLGDDGPTESEATPSPDRDDGSWIQVSDESDLPFHQQVADQIRDAVASGRLVPGQRLPTVRGLAESLDLAPGTVAKAYRALDSEGVIETAGARGTLVALPRGREGDPMERVQALEDLLRPVAVAAFHMGASLDEFRKAADRAVQGVLESGRHRPGEGRPGPKGGSR